MASTTSNPLVTRRHFLHLAAASSAVTLLAACGQTAGPTQTQPAVEPTKAKPVTQPTAVNAVAPAAATAKPGGPKRGGILRIGMSAGIVNFNPYNWRDGHAGFRRQIYESLLGYNERLEPEPQLAEKWDVSSDGRSVTFHLRQGVKFHSSREFTAEDVKFSAEFAMNDESVIPRGLFQPIKGLEIVNKYAITFRFDTVHPGVFDIANMCYGIDKESIGSITNVAIGTGPFKLERYVPNDRIELVANKDYWQLGKPYLDRQVTTIVPDKQALVLNLESGAIDYAAAVTTVDAVRLKEQATKFKILEDLPGSSMLYLSINTKAEPFTNKKVRQAMAWSIDRERFCRTALQGLAKPTCLMWPSNSWAYFADLDGSIGYDLDKARSLLKEAGFPNGFETELMASSKRQQVLLDLAVMLQADLRKIGVNAKVVDAEPAVYANRQLSKDTILHTHIYGRSNLDPGTLVTGAMAWYNDKQGSWTRFDNAEYDRLRDEMQSTLDQEKRKATARKIQQLVLDELPCCLVTSVPQLNAIGSYVKDVKMNWNHVPLTTETWLDM